MAILPLRFTLIKAKNPDEKSPVRRCGSISTARAGWGVDAVHLARRGITVTAVEKNPVVAALLAHAHAACGDRKLKARLVIGHGDSIAYLGGMQILPAWCTSTRCIRRRSRRRRIINSAGKQCRQGYFPGTDEEADIGSLLEAHAADALLLAGGQ